MTVRGWCPTLMRPMAAGDGLLVRVRPPLGRLTADQATALAEAALAFGNGAIDLTSRAGLQLRGITEASWPRLVDRLAGVGLGEAPGVAITIAPDWREGDDVHRIATQLEARRAEFPDLPPKMSVVVDTGATARLTATPGDIRIERGETGRLLLRADGHTLGAAVPPGREVNAAIALAHWFVATGGPSSGRMARHRALLPDFASGALRPLASPPLLPGAHPLGIALALPFGRLEATELRDLAAGGAGGIRVTPWRMVIVEGLADVSMQADPALRDVDACPGAPACPQASVDTRPLARLLAPHVAGLHVSGCGKGCARSGAAPVVLTGRDGRFDLAFDARAGDAPHATGLTAADLLARFGAR